MAHARDEAKRLVGAYQSHTGRTIQQNQQMADEILKLRQDKTHGLEKIALMEHQIKLLKEQLNLSKNRTLDLEKELLSFQINEGDSNYDVKMESCQLQRMCVDFHSRAMKAEEKLAQA